jgi:ribosomal protein S14
VLKDQIGVGSSPEAIEYRKIVRKRFHANHPKYGMSKHRRDKFGITEKQFEELKSKQNNRCAICGELEPGFRKGVRKELAVDHNKITGQNRGLLCSLCNTAIGSMKENVDNLKKAIDYLVLYSRI